MQGDDRVLQSNEAKKMPRTKAMEESTAGLMRAKGFGVTAVNCYGFLAIFHHGYLR